MEAVTRGNPNLQDVIVDMQKIIVRLSFVATNFPTHKKMEKWIDDHWMLTVLKHNPNGIFVYPITIALTH